jgi:hypothetical protein
MDDWKNQANAQLSANSAKMMSPRGQLVVAILFSLLSIALAFVMVDKIFTEALLSLNGTAGTGTVTKLTQTRSRSVTSYWVSYSFEVDGKKYERMWAFGLLKKETGIYTADRAAFSEGASIEVVYSKLAPGINVPVYDPYRNDKSIFILVGALLFGFLAVNIFKNLRKKEPLGSAPRPASSETGAPT